MKSAEKARKLKKESEIMADPHSNYATAMLAYQDLSNALDIYASFFEVYRREEWRDIDKKGAIYGSYNIVKDLVKLRKRMHKNVMQYVSEKAEALLKNEDSHGTRTAP